MILYICAIYKIYFLELFFKYIFNYLINFRIVETVIYLKYDSVLALVLYSSPSQGEDLALD